MAKTGKLKIERYFTKEGNNYPINYIKSDVQITDETGKPLFIQKDVEFPDYFSELSKRIVASRYFYGEHGTSEREDSLDQLVGRVTDTYSKWAVAQGYMDKDQAKVFAEELANLNLTQRMSFNSPVWFNVGTDRYESRKSNEPKIVYSLIDGEAHLVPAGKDHLYPQTSACFIQSVEDTMEGIMQLAVNEAMLFKYGSGTGTDLSTLRSSREKLSGGGKPSGPLAYLVHFDKLAGIVKSGGKTRRAAKMDSLRVDHPDIKEFIEAKKNEEKKIEILMCNGISSKEAAESVHFQNTNMSIRITDEFMSAVENDAEFQTIPVHNKELGEQMPKYKTRDLLHLIAEGTWICGDPGVQYHDTINKWHTCKSSGPIKASNPCSEYMFLDDSSCNLASLNLRGFIDENGNFDIEEFKNAVRTTAIAMELNYDNSSFPTKKIAENSHEFRPLGLGFSNLGSLIMSLGLPYDSDEARNIAAAITSLMTATVYETSAEMAKNLGPFKRFAENKQSMIEVIKMHKDYSERLVKSIRDSKKINFNLEEIAEEADKTWKKDINQGNRYGFRNAQATVLAPTGTISYMMDCDTLGIEPETGLIQTKLLAEGGILKRVNGTVPFALKKLGYNEEEIEKIKAYIDENQTAEGCDILKPEHVAVFDCAMKPKNAKRAIHYIGHIKMMAAVQPFLSGAISKTVNMPNEAGVEEIEQVYTEAWKSGLKAVAIYRDGSKSRQPLSFSKREKLEEKINGRRKLPNTRRSVTHKFSVVGHEGYLHVGLYDDGTPGELFINMSKEGSTIGGLMDCFATSISMNMQYGAPLESLINKFKNQRFEPAGYVNEGDELMVGTEVSSLVDYIFRWLEKTFIEKNEEKGVKKKCEEKTLDDSGVTKIKPTETSEELGGFCPICGSMMIKKGNCKEVCLKCNFVDPKGCTGAA
jgi:ribonucleoside-diphosphate reductase alpha chain